MEQLIEALGERFGLTRADLLGLAVALTGCVVATLVAVRVPLLAAVGDRPAAPVDAVVDGGPGPGHVEEGGELVVHVAGAVVTPGVVRLPPGARVADAIAAAGGPGVDAAPGRLNLARLLVDGEQVLVPTVDEPAPGGETAALDDAELPDGRLDLNAASAAELEQLPGVGPVLAGRIVAHREEHGPFVESSQLREVSGIGEATWLRLRDLVGVR